MRENAPVSVRPQTAQGHRFYYFQRKGEFFMAEKQSNKERIKEITAGIEKGIMELFESDRYRNYLTTMSRFHRYSLHAVLLLLQAH